MKPLDMYFVKHLRMRAFYNKNTIIFTYIYSTGELAVTSQMNREGEIHLQYFPLINSFAVNNTDLLKFICCFVL
jgi:hypothetical protein